MTEVSFTNDPVPPCIATGNEEILCLQCLLSNMIISVELVNPFLDNPVVINISGVQ